MRRGGTPLLALLLALPLAAQNSTRKIRPEPGPLASRAGSAVDWRESLAAAKQESERTGKPLFWYVPTVSGSPMDRKAEIDRYMMAGPFSWPTTIALLNDAFIPVKAVPAGREQRERKLRPFEFIEPGYLVLGGAGEELYRLDKITTLHPEWFEAPLRELVGVLRPPDTRPEYLKSFWSWFFSKGGDTGSLSEWMSFSPPQRAEAMFVRGATLFRRGQHEDARRQWRRAARLHPDEPMAWKAAAEAEGHGPFVRGFEVFVDLPEGMLSAVREGSRAPAGVYDEDTLVRRSVEFLKRMRADDGSYRDSGYDFGGTDSLPNVHMACTAIAGKALLEIFTLYEGRTAAEIWGELKTGGGLSGYEPRFADGLSSNIRTVLWYTKDDSNLNPDDTDEIIWAHIYRVRLFARMVELGIFTRGEDLPSHLQRVVDAIQDLQPESGAWFHEYSNPFVIAATLIALKRAQEAGATVSQRHVDRGVLALLRTRAQNGAFSYGFGGSPEGTRIPAAAGRMPLCELALSLWGEGRQGALENALRAAFQHHQELEDSRKYDDHAGPYAYGGFFFWFDMHARSEAIASMPDGELKEELKKKQRDLLLSLPEFDGCFVDSHELGRTYGTAMALLSFAALR